MIVVPLHACGSAVRVTGVQPNRLVGIDANVPNTSLWWAIGMAWATETTVDVSVNAAFMNQALQFRLFELDCGVKTTGPAVQMPKVAQFSAPEVGDPAPNDPAKLQVLDCGSIHIKKIVPGALVDLYRIRWNHIKGTPNYQQSPGPLYTQTWLATYASATSEMWVLRSRQLEIDDSVVAQQRICGNTSPMSQGAAIVAGTTIKRNDIPTNICELASNLPSARLAIATDLGVPLEFNGSVYLFFGDAGPWGGALAIECQGQEVCKPIFRVHPDANGCLTSSPLICGDFQKLEIDSGLSPLSFMEVPSGAFSYDGKIYLFITKSIAGSKAFHNSDNMASSYLVSATSECQTFHEELLVDSSQFGDPVNDLGNPLLRFINVCPVVIRNADWPGLPQATGDGVLLWELELTKLAMSSWHGLHSHQKRPSLLTICSFALSQAVLASKKESPGISSPTLCQPD